LLAIGATAAATAPSRPERDTATRTAARTNRRAPEDSVVIALFPDLTVVDDENAIGVLDRRQAWATISAVRFFNSSLSAS
jgi:hypothetical protein